MINEVTQLMTRWARHEVHGVNALIPSVFRSPGHPEPKPVVIYNDVDDKQIADNFDPPESPALVIVADSDADTPVILHRTQQDLPRFLVAMVYIVRDPESEMQARRDAGYVLGAAYESLVRFNQPKLSSPGSGEVPDYRSWYDKVKVHDVLELSEHRVTGAVGRSKLIGVLLATVRGGRVGF